MKIQNLRKVSTHVFLAVVVVAIMFSLSTLGLLTMTQTIGSSGSITSINVGVYSDSTCSTPINTLTWGIVSPGASATKTVYIKNSGNVPLTLSMHTDSWSPPTAAQSITVSWNKESTQLNPGLSISADLTLTVSQSISGITTFSMNIVISGTG
jgi:hypothetical protein